MAENNNSELGGKTRISRREALIKGGVVAGAGLAAGTGLLSGATAGASKVPYTKFSGVVGGEKKYTTSVNIVTGTGLVFSPWYIAKSLGYFTKLGLTNTIPAVGPSATQVAELIGNQVQFINSSPGAASNNAILGGAPIAAVAAGSYLTAQYPDGVYLVSPGAAAAGVTSVAQLAGKKVGLFLGWDGVAGLALYRAAKNAGIANPLTAFQTTTFTSFPIMTQALLANTIDSCSSQEPFTSQLTAAGCKILFADYTVLLDDPALCVFGNTGWMKANEEVTVRVLMGYLSGIHTYKQARDSKFTKPKQAINAILLASGLTAAQLPTITPTNLPTDGQIPLQAVNLQLNWAKAYGDVQTIVPQSQWIEETYVKEAYNRLVRNKWHLKATSY